MPRLATYGGAQGIVLVVNAISGFILVRGMGKEEYAWFTIANSLLATISVMADSGLGSAMMSMGGAVCENRPRFASLMRVGQALRIRYMAFAALVTLPAGWWVLSRNAAPWPVIVGLLVLVIITSIRSVEAVVLGTINKLHRRISFLLQADLCLSLSRFVLVALGMLPGLTATIAIAATTGSQWLTVWLLRRQTHEDLVVKEEVQEDWRPGISGVVRNLFPLCFFNCVQAHITTWLLSVFAATQEVADVGALTRLGVLFSFLGIPLTQLVTPLISRTQKPGRLARLCVLALGGSILAALALVLLGTIFSTQVLWLLGQKYAHLHHELTWFLASQTLAVAANAAWGIAFTRSWVRYAWLQIPLTILLQCIAAPLMDFSQITHAIQFASISNLVGFVIATGLVLQGVRHRARDHKREQAAPQPS